MSAYITQVVLLCPRHEIVLAIPLTHLARVSRRNNLQDGSMKTENTAQNGAKLFSEVAVPLQTLHVAKPPLIKLHAALHSASAMEIAAMVLVRF